MKMITQALIELKEKVLIELKKGKNDELVKIKRNIEKLIKVTSSMDNELEYIIDPEVIVLPKFEQVNSFAQYYVIDDNESDEMEDWTKVMQNGEPIRLYPGDIIIRDKP